MGRRAEKGVELLSRLTCCPAFVIQVWCYLSSSLATHCILSLADLEAGLFEYLQRSGLRSIDSFFPSHTDPQEIDLDAPAAEPATNVGKVGCFEEVGLGPLHRHPLLCVHFARPADSPASEAEVLRLLAMELANDSSDMHAALQRALSRLCADRGCSEASQLGVAVQASLLAPLVSALKDVVRRKALSTLQLLDQSPAPTAQPGFGRVEDVVVTLLPTQNATLEHCLEQLPASKRRPSFAKVEAWIQSSLPDWQSDHAEAVQAMLVEYAFLRLGARKATRSRFSLRLAADAEAENEKLHAELRLAVEAEADAKAGNRKRPLEDNPAPASAAERLEARIGSPAAGSALHNPNFLEAVPEATVREVLLSLPSRQLLGEDVGRYGERLVAALLTYQVPASSLVEWQNRDGESLAAYDLVVKHAAPHPHTVFVEVKTSRFADKNVFELSPNEWAFAEQVHKAGSSLMAYHLYRVLDVDGVHGGVKVWVVKDLLACVQSGVGKLCLAL